MQLFIGASLIVFQIFSDITNIFCADVQKNQQRADRETELILVSVIFRHGARTTYDFYPTDPNINNTFYPVGLGGLTNEGKMGEFKLGQYLRHKYGDFVGDYTEEKVYVRSTDVTRTRMSAQLVLAALFPPGKEQTWNEELPWQPIPVDYKPIEDDDLYHPKVGVCPYRDAAIAKLNEDREILEIYQKPFQDLYKFIEKHSGKPMRVPHDMLDIFFVLKSEKDMNLPIPDWTNGIFPEQIEKAACIVYAFGNSDPKLRQINSGFMLKKILSDSKDKIVGKNEKKRIYLYSGHETTLGYILDALNVTESHIPSYGSAISFEVHRKDGRHFIKITYRIDPEATESVDLVLPGCDVLCPFGTFVDLVQDLIPQKSMHEECQIADKTDKQISSLL